MYENKTILGLHVTGNQSAASLFQRGELVAAVAEERLVRRKRTLEFPSNAVRHCLETAGLKDLSPVDHIVVSWNPAVHLNAINRSGFTSWRRYDPEWLYIVPNNLFHLMPGAETGATRQTFGEQRDKFVYLDHHQAHLGWAFASEFDSAAIAVIDEHGEVDTVTMGKLTGNDVQIFSKSKFPNSLGIFYAAMTSYLGFTPYGDEWKVMGAAAFGDPARFSKTLGELVQIRDGHVFLDQNFIEFGNTRTAGYFGSPLTNHIGLPVRHADTPLEQAHFDLAAAAQAVFEDKLFDLLCWLHERTGERNLVLNGGCAMNSLANGKIFERTPFRDVFVGPAAADNGCAIGGPLFVLGELNAGNPSWRCKIPAGTGPTYNDAEILNELQKYKIGFEQTADIAADTADLIAGGAIVGWFQGPMEFGERALGHRSILADPRDANMKDLVNATVKYREGFRPFAPSVTEDAAGEYFDLPYDKPVRYMERVTPVKAARHSDIPAVVHADGTARLQTVRRADNPVFYDCIKQFGDRTGTPVLLNTSFNLNGEPIVCSPADAIRTFYSSGLDVLVIGNFIVKKWIKNGKDQPVARNHDTSLRPEMVKD